jgi:DNA primase
VRIEEVKRKVRIEDLLHLVGGHLPAYSDGWRNMRCPFHEDRRASGSVNIVLQRFRCHSCGVGGDVLDLAGAYLGTADWRVQKEWLETTFIR